MTHKARHLAATFRPSPLRGSATQAAAPVARQAVELRTAVTEAKQTSLLMSVTTGM